VIFGKFFAGASADIALEVTMMRCVEPAQTSSPSKNQTMR